MTESCSDVHLRVCCCRTENEDCCCSVGSPRQKITGDVFADDRSMAGVVSSVGTVAAFVTAAGTAATGTYCSSRFCLRLLLRASQQQEEEGWWSTSRDGSHRSGPLEEQHCVGSGHVYDLMGRMQLVHGIQGEKTNEKQ